MRTSDVKRTKRSHRLSDEEYAKIKEILAYYRAHMPCRMEFRGVMTNRKLRVFRLSDDENRLVKMLMTLWKIGASEEQIQDALRRE